MSVNPLNPDHINQMALIPVRTGFYEQQSQQEVLELALVLEEAYCERYEDECFDRSKVISEVKFICNEVTKEPDMALDVIDLLKMVECYEYQVQGLDGYAGRWACQLCARYKHMLIKQLSGYAGAVWEYRPGIKKKPAEVVRKWEDNTYDPDKKLLDELEKELFRR